MKDTRYSLIVGLIIYYHEIKSTGIFILFFFKHPGVTSPVWCLVSELIYGRVYREHVVVEVSPHWSDAGLGGLSL